MVKLKLKRKKKKGRGKSKGSQFEREMCRTLSLWWTDDKRDDIFWRSSQSGGRATNRSKKGLETAGSYGDVTALDSIGEPLTKNIVIELKRGINKACPDEFLSKKETPEYLNWIDQTLPACQQLGTPHWWIIHKRDQYDPVLIASKWFWDSLEYDPENVIMIDDYRLDSRGVGLVYVCSLSKVLNSSAFKKRVKAICNVK